MVSYLMFYCLVSHAGDCIFQDYNENLTYTVFPNVTWTITCFTYSDEISDIMCMADGTWSVPNLCLSKG